MQRHLRAIGPVLTLLLIGIIAVGIIPAAPAHALGTTIIVKTSLGDAVNSGDGCTLREAMQRLFSAVADCGGAQASGLVFITFDTPGMIKLTGGQLPNINSNAILTITGPIIIDGNNDNMFVVKDTGTLILAGLTLTKGGRAITVDSGGSLDVAGVSFLSNSQGGAGGGAIYSSGTVKIAGSLFTANTAPGGSGGAILAGGPDSLAIAGTIFSGNTAKISGGAIYATAKTSLTDTIFNGNIGQGDDGDSDSWDEGGGAVFFANSDEAKPLTVTRGVFNGNLSPKGSGGAIFANVDSTVTIQDSALNGNLAGTPSNPRSGGAIYSAANTTVVHSTFLNNGVVGNGGAIANDRKGILGLSNSTLVANAATFDPIDPTGGLGQGGGVATLNSQTGSDIRPKSTLLNVTLALNASLGGGGGAGGGLYSQAPSGSYPIVTVLGNTIISGSDGAGGNCGGGAYTSNGHNLDSGASCGLGGAGDLSNADAKLDTPFFNGGPIPTLLTMKLKPGSAALDAGDAAICAAAPVSGEDERGTARPQDGDGAPPAACDIGAYEGDAVFPGFGSTPVAPGPIPFGNATVGTSQPGSLSVFNTGDATLTISAGSLSGADKADFALTTAFPISIAAGAPATPIGLTCAPSASGPRSATLSLSSNAPGAASVNFTLSCAGTPVPAAGFGSTPPAPGPIDLGKVRLGDSASAPLSIKEVGTASLSVTGISIGGLNPGDFSLSSAANISIADGAAAVARNVICTPTALGQRSASLTMQTNDPGAASVSFSLSCTGAPAPQLVFETSGVSAATVSGPYGVTLDPQGDHIYVSNDGGFAQNSASVIRYLRNGSGYPTSGVGHLDGASGGNFLAGSMRSMVSPDGTFVYATAYTDDAINVYARNADGTLTFNESVKFGDTYGFFCAPQPCSLPTVQGLNGAYGMALSPDGKYMYVSGVSSNSITVLARNRDTGSLKSTLVFTRPAVVQEYQDSTNLNGAYDIAISPDGQYLYATGYGSDTLVVLKRNPSDGKLTPVSGGVYGVAQAPSLNGVFRVTLSPDGNFVYTSSYQSNAVTAFQRDPSTGKLTPVSGGVYGDGVAGHATTSAAVSPDGKYLFATEYAATYGAVLVYLRDQATGGLDMLQTIATPDIAGARDVAVAPDGRMIFVSGHAANKVVGFAIANPVPVLTSLDPASATAGSPQISLTIHGEGFAPGAVATWGGADLAGTQFISPNEVTVPLPAGKLAAAGAAQVGVRNPAPAGGSSANTLAFTITAPAVGNTPAANPVPSITKLVPSSALAGSPSQLVTVTGAGFIPSSTVLWNGADRPTTYVDGTTLQFTVGAADLIQPGASSVVVRNPAPGGGPSNGVGFDVAAPGENPVPAISSISPKSAIAGSVSTDLLVTISGASFMPESQARWEGNARPTTYISPTQLQVAISGGDLLEVGVYRIDVVNPGPGGGPSNSAIFRVGGVGSNPVPSLRSAELTFAAGGLQVKLIGQGFIAGSKVIWSGAIYTPTAVSPTEIVLTVPLAAARSASVRVENPAPGGGASDALLVTISRVALPLVRR